LGYIATLNFPKQNCPQAPVKMGDYGIKKALPEQSFFDS
jgi:hypothetical protein